MWDIARGPFSRQEIPFDIRKVPADEIIEKLVEQVRGRYPTVYQVLIEERNVIMARKLRKLMEKYPGDKIVAVVGAGHEKEMYRLLQN